LEELNQKEIMRGYILRYEGLEGFLCVGEREYFEKV
jgi:hypothetical protein